jgi:hypothetical protein
VTPDHFRHHCQVICCNLSDLAMLVIDVDGIDRHRCSMETLIDVQMEESEDCARPQRHLDLASDCKRDLGKLKETSMIDEVRWDCRGVSIVCEFEILLMVMVDASAHPFRLRFHCRCGKDCIVGSLAASVKQEFSNCSLDTTSRDSVRSIDAELYVASAVFVRNYHY